MANYFNIRIKLYLPTRIVKLWCYNLPTLFIDQIRSINFLKSLAVNVLINLAGLAGSVSVDLIIEKISLQIPAKVFELKLSDILDAYRHTIQIYQVTCIVLELARGKWKIERVRNLLVDNFSVVGIVLVLSVDDGPNNAKRFEKASIVVLSS